MRRPPSEVLLIFFVLFIESSQLCLCKNLTDEGSIEEERQALLKFADSFVSCSRHVLAWEGKKYCKWKGVKCDAFTGHVLKIDLSQIANPMKPPFTNGSLFLDRCIWLSKAMSPSLQELKHLSYLDLSSIFFQYSPIPLFLGSMKQLRYLNLAFCGFRGRVPHQLGNLTNLQVLDLKSFPPNVLFMDDFSRISHLSSLQYLDMSGVTIRNEIDSMMQVIHNLPFLLEAHFEDCKILSSKTSHGFVNSSSLPSLLQVLCLSRNSLNTIPKASRNMSSLTWLDISDNKLDSVPLWLGEFKFLAHLDLHSNKLTGSFPVAIQNISCLEFLSLASNNLTSAVPLWFIKRVQRVTLFNNTFSTLESSCPWNSKINCNLKSLDLFPDKKFHGQTFGGSNDTSMFIKNDIQELDLSENILKDSLESLGQLKNLRYLTLASNLFCGPIPLSFRNMTKLRVLLLKDNQFNGTIPEFFGRFSTLTEMDLSENHLGGIIPADLGNLIYLNLLDLSHNSFEGTLKEIHLDNMSDLQYLSLGMNKLSVELAPNWLPPFQLWSLQLSSCRIETPFPQWLRNQEKLGQLDLSNTGLWGTLPTWFQRKELKVLDLSNNKISGQLPRDLHHMMPNLVELFLANNLLNGSIPESLCKFPLLRDLDLSKNRLSSEIPSCLGEVFAIVLIDLSSNELSGTIPESFCGFNSSFLQSLNLSNNSLEGELPSTLRSCNKLEVLDLGNNELYGIIPSSIWANSSRLKILRLRQNKFNGTIPLGLCQLSVLQSLDLASNNLVGAVPSCLGNLKGMTLNLSSDWGSTEFMAPLLAKYLVFLPAFFLRDFDEWDKEDVKQVMKGRELDFTKNLKFVVNLDLSDNSLIGFIPEVLTSLTKLVGLNLSHNFLSGEIPSKIGTLKLLESLDVSWNQLAGPLPSSMSSLTYLSHLNLSYNNFSGPIPEGNQFPTLEDASIYVGNQYLCGEPVLKKCSDNNKNEVPTSVHYEEENKKEKILFYFVVAVGYMTGFWGIIALLVFNKSLRYVCFRYAEKIADEIYVAVAIRVARLKGIGLKPW